MSPLPWLCASAPGLTAAVAAAAHAGAVRPDAVGWTAGAAAIGLLSAFGLAARDPGLGWFGPAVCVGPRHRPLTALTFDDGPDPGATPAILDALAADGDRATFFVLTHAAMQHRELLSRVAVDHEIGLHGATHDAHLTWASPAAGARELRDAADRLSDAIGRAVLWYRPPFGATSPRLTEAVRRAGLTTVWCSVRTWDGIDRPIHQLEASIRRVGPGDIVLLHDRRRTADALPRLLAPLRGAGLRSVPVGELLGGGR